MSWKIYNGMILRDATLEEALEKAKQLRHACLPKVKRVVHTKAARELALQADIRANQILGIDDEDMLKIRDMASKAQVRVLGKGIRAPEWDWSFSICFIPLRSDVLVLHFMENDAGFTEEMKQLGFEDFHYQTSTDQPSDISEADWEARAEAWREVGMMDYIAPGEMGFNFEVISWRDIQVAAHEVKEIEAVELDPEQRKRAVARIKAEELLRDWIAEVKPPISKIMARARKVTEERQDEMVLARRWFDINRIF